MRHSRHYVDELLGDAPLRTVREIPIGEIELPIEDAAQLEDLESSIRRFGMFDPLLVCRYGVRYRVISGMRRLRAAHKLGLGTVPCLVYDADDQRIRDMRDAAMQRFEPPPPPEPEPAPQPAAAPVEAPPTPLGEAFQGLEFVSALLPAMNAAGNDRLRWTVLADLAGVELLRSKMVAAAADALARTTPLDKAPLSYRLLLDAVASAV